MGNLRFTSLPEDVVRRSIVLREQGIEIALQDWGGDGPLALLHHATGFCAALWAPVAARLRDRFHVVAMDAHAHGDSPRVEARVDSDDFSWSLMTEDLRAVAGILLEETGHQQIALGLGHSFGGTLTMTAESRQPGLYDRLVLVEPVIPTSETPAGERIDRKNDLIERTRKRRDRWPTREAALQQLSSKELFEKWAPGTLELYVQEALRDTSDGEVELKCDREVEAEVFVNSFSIDLQQVFPNVHADVLIAWGQHGNYPLESYQDMCGRLPNAKLVEADAGHLIPMEKPDWLVEQILGFCA